MPSEQQQTSFSNQDYNLVSTLYHSLKSAQTYATYAQDSQASGDQELARFFQQMQQQCDQCAGQAKQLLAMKAAMSGPH